MQDSAKKCNAMQCKTVQHIAIQKSQCSTKNKENETKYDSV